jgi:N4-(beta-N-acetylglucosaminyl)-L-asparaginase
MSEAIGSLDRRRFLGSLVASSGSVLLAGRGAAEDPPPEHDHSMHAAHNHPKPVRPEVPRLPAVLCPITGTVGIDAAYAMLKQGGDTLDAALHLAETQEDDPDDHTVGLGGLPADDGVVRLDAGCWHGPSGRSGAVAGVTGIRNPARLARAWMEHTGYTLLVGPDAEHFASEQGFAKQDLSTDRTRRMWRLWKRIQAHPELLGPGLFDPSWPEPGRRLRFLPQSQQLLDELVNKLEALAVEEGIEPQWTWRSVYDALFPAARPLFIAAVSAPREMSCVATTSGLPWRMAGATGDQAALGAGSFLDPAVGAAGASGSAEANLRVCGAHAIVENMRRGMSPEEAGMDVLRRIAESYRNDPIALRFVEIVYYILRNDGAYGCVSLWHGDRTGHVRQFTIHDGVRRSEDCRYLFDGNPPNGTRAAG